MSKCKYNSRINKCNKESFTISPHTRVCSRHFKKEDFREPGSETGRRLLKKGAVPMLTTISVFHFQDQGFGCGESDQRRMTPRTLGCLAVVDLVLDENMSLRDEIIQLRKQTETFTMKLRFCIYHFCWLKQRHSLFYKVSSSADSYNKLMLFDRIHHKFSNQTLNQKQPQSFS
uniref:THAP-type domain-containing protein n=1 Tax=Erpetoichthys calabaricus TaxID=27687 RepID=A0A8C4RUT2_ERPCA